MSHFLDRQTGAELDCGDSNCAGNERIHTGLALLKSPLTAITMAHWGFFPGLEVDGRVTEIVGVKAFETPSSGWYRDKAFDVKYRFLPESKYGPALALGIVGPQGTRLYPSQYLVASKQIYPFDFTIGFGNGRFGKKPLAPSNEDIKAEMSY